LQPGSTVATSLSEGESKPKHVFVLEIRGLQFRCTPIPLRCIRPFGLRNITLSTDAKIDPSAADSESRVAKYLEKCVRELIDVTKRARLGENIPETLRPPPSMYKPLIRLKVNHEGFTTISNARFGSIFAEEVANPNDILLFWKPVKRGTTSDFSTMPMDEHEANMNNMIMPGRGGGASEIRVETLVAEQLKLAQLTLLEEETLTRGLEEFVEGDSSAIKETITQALENSQRVVGKSVTIKNIKDIDRILVTDRETRKGIESASRKNDSTIKTSTIKKKNTKSTSMNLDVSSSDAESTMNIEDSIEAQATRVGRGNLKYIDPDALEAAKDEENLKLLGLSSKMKMSKKDTIKSIPKTTTSETRKVHSRAAATKGVNARQIIQQQEFDEDDEDDEDIYTAKDAAQDFEEDEDDEKVSKPRQRKTTVTSTKIVAKARKSTKQQEVHESDNDDNVDEDDGISIVTSGTKRSAAIAKISTTDTSSSTSKFSNNKPNVSTSSPKSSGTQSFSRSLPWQKK
jgi:double-strand break repair protein MRE11